MTATAQQLRKGKKTKAARREHGNKAAYGFLAPYVILFTAFIPMVVAIGLSFTSYDTIQMPTFKGFLNYINLLTADDIFMQKVLPNTIIYALIVGPGGYILSFLVAWALAQLSSVPRTVLTVIFYSPSMTGATYCGRSYSPAIRWAISTAG